ncbi:MAG TPA: hypothetical protein ENN67_03255 [Firmicutes bacterium]|nr:hypothetical protein [Bacillota bacterium]
MLPSNRTVKQAWIWALGINIVVFAILWVVLVRMPLPTKATTPDRDSGSAISDQSDPGGTFGQISRLVGDDSANNGDDSDDGSDVVPDEIPEPDTPPVQPEPVSAEPVSTTPDAPSTTPAPERWINEFYVGPDPALSFATRLNPDGSPRPHPSNLDWYKGPAYDDESTRLSRDDINIPVPDLFFAKKDLPNEYRQYNHTLTLRVRLDSRGRIQGEPEIVESSGYPTVDRITIDKIKNEVSFAPATRKDNGQPVPVVLPLLVFWN